MAEVVGTAYVRIRAITDQLKKDIEDAVERGASDADVDSAAETIGRRFSRSFADAISDNEDDFDITDALGAADYRRVAASIASNFSAEFERSVRPEIGRIGNDMGDVFGTQFALGAGTRIGSEVDVDPIRQAFDPADIIDAEIIEDFSMAGRQIGASFARGAEVEIFNGLNNALQNTTDEIQRNVDVDNEGRRFGDRFVEGFKHILQAQMSPGGPFDRILRRLGAGGGNSYGRGFRGTIARYFVGLAPALVAPLAGIINLIIQYIVTLVGQLGFLVTAAVGAGAAIGTAFGAAALAIVPIISAFAAETPALERLKEAATELADAWDVVGIAVQDQLFPALENLFDVVQSDLIPGFTEYASVIGGVSSEFVNMLSVLLRSEQVQSRLNTTYTFSADIFKSITDTLLILADSLSIVFVASLPLAQRFASSIEQLALRWNQLITDAEASGSLSETLTTWYDRAVLVYNVLGDIASGLFNVFEIGAQVTTPFFDRFAAWAQEWRDFTESEVGENRIRDVFESASVVAHEFNLLVADIVERLFGNAIDGDNSTLVRTLRSIREDWLPGIDAFLTRIAEQTGPALANLFESIGEIFQTLSETGSLSVTATIISAIADSLAFMVQIPGVGQFVGAMLGLFGAFKLLSILGVPQIFTFLAKNPIIAAIVASLAAIAIMANFVKDNWGELSSVLPLFVGPLGAAAFIIGGVAANFETLRDILNEVVGAVSRFGERVGSVVSGALSSFYNEVLVPIGEFLGGVFAAAWDTAGDAIGRALDIVSDVGSTAFDAITEAASFLWNDILVPLADFLSNVFSAAWETASEAPGFFLDNVITPLGDALQWIWREILEPFAAWLGEIFAPIWEAIVDVWQADVMPILRDIGEALSVLWNDYLQPIADFLGGVFGPVWTAISTTLSVLFNTVIKPFSDFLKGEFTAALTGLLAIISPIAGVVAGILTGAFSTLWNTVLVPLGNFLVTVFNQAWQTLGMAWNFIVLPALTALAAAFSWLWNVVLVPLGNFLTTVFSVIWSGLSILWNTIVYPAIVAVGNGLLWLWNTVLSPVWNFISTSLIPIFQQTAITLATILGGAIRAMGATLSFVWNSIVRPFASFLQAAFSVAVNIAKSVINGLKAAFDAVATAVSAAWDWVKGIAGYLAGLVGSTLTSAWNGVVSVFETISSVIETAVGWVESLISAIGRIPDIPSLPGADAPIIGRVIPGANGGIFDRPTNMLIGEAGREVLLPLTRPQRARELAASSGLYDVLFGGRGTQAGINFGDGSIQVTFMGSTPTTAEARSVGREVGNGIVDVLSKRRINSGARTG